MAASTNVLFGFPNLAIPDYWAPTISGGIWQPATPLTNLQQTDFAYKVRSQNCTTDSAQFVVDLKGPQVINTVAIPRTNMLPSTSPTATCNIYTDAALTNLVATSTVTIFPIIYAFGSLAFEHPSWLDGKLTNEAARFVPQPILFVFPTSTVGNYVQVIVNDPNNAAGYIELTPPVYICPGYQPTLNIKYGSQIGYSDPSIISHSLGWKKFVDARPIGRQFVGSIDYLPQNEAFSNVLDMQIRLGVGIDMFFSMLPGDANNIARVSFPATLTKLDMLTAASFGLQGVAFSIEEKIA